MEGTFLYPLSLTSMVLTLSKSLPDSAYKLDIWAFGPMRIVKYIDHANGCMIIGFLGTMLFMGHMECPKAYIFFITLSLIKIM